LSIVLMSPRAWTPQSTRICVPLLPFEPWPSGGKEIRKQSPKPILYMRMRTLLRRPPSGLAARFFVAFAAGFAVTLREFVVLPAPILVPPMHQVEAFRKLRNQPA